MEKKQELALECLNEGLAEIGLYVGILNDKKVSKAFDALGQAIICFEQGVNARDVINDVLEE